MFYWEKMYEQSTICNSLYGNDVTQLFLYVVNNRAFDVFEILEVMPLTGIMFPIYCILLY